MYLSLLQLNPLSRTANRDVQDVARLHRTIMGAFPQAPDGASARAHYKVLYRLETHRDGGNLALYVQSEILPRWQNLSSDYVVAEGEPRIAVKSVAEAYERIRNGQRLRFRLRANPTRKIDTKTQADGRRRHGRRVPVRGEKEQIDWLLRQGQRHGFALTEVDIRSSGSAELWRSRSTGRTFQGVIYEGRLVVTDRSAFVRALREGIGPGKAFGFGLLSVAP